MALFTSTGGKFEITALSFSPKVAAWGDQVSITISMKNKSSSTVTKPYFILQIAYTNTSGAQKFVPLIANGSTGTPTYIGSSWTSGKTVTRTYTGTLTKPSDMQDSSQRCMQPVSGSGAFVGIYTFNESASTFNSQDTFKNIYGSSNEYLAVVDKHYSPSIPSFEVSRVSDESTSVWTTLKLSCASGLDTTQKARMAYKAYVDGKEVTIPSSITQNMLFSGITENTTFLSGTEVGTDVDHVVMVTWGDSYESASASYTVLRSFANLHLSGYSTGGACFGGFCSNETDATTGAHVAKLESYYPIYARKGIQNIQAGVSGSISVASGQIGTYTASYSFSSAPVVIATAYSNSTAAAMGSLLVAVKQSTVTATGCTINIYNNTGASRTLYVSWLAYGLPTT